MSEIQQLFSANLKAIRKEKKMSQQAIADNSDMLASTVNRIENMKVAPSIDTVEKIAKALDVSFVDLFKSNEISDLSVVDKIKAIENLSDYNRSVVNILLDSIIDKDKLEKTQAIKMQKRLEELKEARK